MVEVADIYHIMVNKTGSSTSHDDILDSFLTTIESKLRGPFSSLDLAKAVSTAALRQSSQIVSSSSNNSSNNNTNNKSGDGSDPAQEYLHNLSSVLGRTNKVIQCRMLIGLLGLNDMRTNKRDTTTSTTDNTTNNTTESQYLTPEILRILHETQEGPLHEEWVRTTSGLIEGVMFRTDSRSDKGNTRESCRGEEASKIICETGTEVCEKVERQIQNVGRPYKHQRKQQQKAMAATDSESGNGSSQERKKPNPPTSATTANKRNRGFIIEKVKSSSSQPAIKMEVQMQSPIKLEQKPSIVERTGPIPPDLNACFAPYRYRLISSPVLNTIIPEFELSKEKSNGVSNSNCHFQVNSAANILQVDLRLETQRAKDHGSGVAAKPKTQSDGRAKPDPTAASKGGKRTFPPGFRPAKIVPGKGGASGKLGVPKPGARSGAGGSSLFMPKKKRPTNLFNTTTKFRPQPAKTMLKRKGGGAQALLKSGATASGGGAILNKLGSSSGGGSSTVSGSTSAGRTRPGGVGRFSSNRDASRAGVGRSSRMKMIDDDDVDTLTKLQRSTAASNMTAAELRASKRKRILEKAAQRGIHGAGGGTAAASGAAAVSSFGNQQSRKKQKVSSTQAAARPEIKREEAATEATEKTEPQQQQQQQQQPNAFESWRSLLSDRSNKMSGDDKIRVEKFFTTTNAAERSALLVPSEGGPIVTMKIHQQRGTDPETGQEIKETFYLELDYATGASKQSKKVKRY